MKIKNILIILLFIFLISNFFIINLDDLIIDNNIEYKENSSVIEETTNNNIEKESNILDDYTPIKIEKYDNEDFISLYDSYEKILFIGDSRTVGLSNVIEDSSINIEFICEVGKGLNWIKEQNIEEKIKDKNTLVFVNLGINDLHNLNEYINYFSNLNINNNIYYISILPVDEIKESKNGYSITNIQIEKFNSKIKESFKYIDLYSYMINHQFDTRDGIHFTNDTYKDIYKYIKNYIRNTKFN